MGRGPRTRVAATRVARLGGEKDDFLVGGDHAIGEDLGGTSAIDTIAAGVGKGVAETRVPGTGSVCPTHMVEEDDVVCFPCRGVVVGCSHPITAWGRRGCVGSG